MTFQEIVDQILDGIRHVVITGGEPTLHSNLPDLVETLAKQGYCVHIETSGTHYKIIKELYNSPWKWWITVSPKRYTKPETLLLADEIKWIIMDESTLDVVDSVWKALVQERLYSREGWREDNIPLFYLQPASCEKKATDLCIQHVLANADRDYRLSIQIHKLIGVR
jgi:organic radical activating enzyme